MLQKVSLLHECRKAFPLSRNPRNRPVSDCVISAYYAAQFAISEVQDNMLTPQFGDACLLLPMANLTSIDEFEFGDFHHW